METLLGEILILIGLDLWPLKTNKEQAVFNVIKSAECAGTSKRCIESCLELTDEDINKALNSLVRKGKISINGSNIKAI